MKSDESHDGKGLHYKKDGCPDVHFTWEKVAKRITDLIQKGRYLTEQEQAEYDKSRQKRPWRKKMPCKPSSRTRLCGNTTASRSATRMI